MQDENGFLVDFSEKVETIYADWHGLSQLDIDLDGDIDFIVSGLHDSIYAFINDGLGNFHVNNQILPIAELNTFRGNSQLFYTNVHAIDLNNDGYKEILLGGTDGPQWYSAGKPYMPVLRSNAGVYSFNHSTDVIDIYNTGNTSQAESVVVEMKSIDFNGDGCQDLIVYQTSYISSAKLNVLENNCFGGFTIVYEHIFDFDGWIDRIYVGDINNDGLLDFYGKTVSDCCQFHAFIWSGDGFFSHSLQNKDTDFEINLITKMQINLWQ